jgi:hypothetical protein
MRTRMGSTLVGFAFGMFVAGFTTLGANATDANGSVTHYVPELLPSGGDDTAQLQAALASCVDPLTACHIRLGEGVFNTDVLLVSGFNGKISGHGKDLTTIRAIPKTRNGPLPFDEEPTLESPYPVLLHFADNSKVAISNLTVDVPAGTTTDPYTQVVFPDWITTNALIAAIVVDGDGEAALDVQHVKVIGADDNTAPNFSTITAAVVFRGNVRVSLESDRSEKLTYGRFTASDNEIVRTGVGFWLADADNVDAAAVTNNVNARTYGVLTEDLGASRFSVVLNDIAAELEGVLLTRSRRPSEYPTDYSVGLNRIQVNEFGLAPFEIVGPSYDGIGVYDWAELPETINFNASIWANEIRVGKTTFAGLSVFSQGTGVIEMIGNCIWGEPAIDASIVVDASRGTLVAHNDLSNNAKELLDVRLGLDSRDVRVYEKYDTVLDEGTNNTVVGKLVPPPAAPVEALSVSVGRHRPRHP